MSRHPYQLMRDCANDLALTLGELMAIAKTAPKRYYVWEIDKRSGKGTRTVCHPARELKAVQYFFLEKLLSKLPVHESATAYVAGSSIKKNASFHVESRVVMKMDFSDFFNSLKVKNWQKYARDHFSEWSADELDFSCRMLFWGAGSYNPKCLAIGAPTSPLLSNALLYEIDIVLSGFAKKSNLNYTRYADDITFSSEDFIEYGEVIESVKNALHKAEYTSLQINSEKTILVSKKFSRKVTGLVITPDNEISLGRDRKRLISSMVHHAATGKLEYSNFARLAGLLAFAVDVEPIFIDRLKAKYSNELINRIIRGTLFED